jgi:hypothetical protein
MMPYTQISNYPGNQLPPGLYFNGTGSGDPGGGSAAGGGKRKAGKKTAKKAPAKPKKKR